MASIQKKTHFRPEEIHSFRFFFLMTIGVLLAWVMVSGIVDTTVFARRHMINFIRVFFIVGMFGLVLLHKYTRRISLALFAVAALLVASGFLFTSEDPGFLNRLAELISGSLAYILGNRGYQYAYERFIIWTISFFFSFFVAFFTYYKFHFWILFPVSAATTALAITSPYFRHNPIFYIYALCILALTIRYLQLKNVEKTNASPKSSIASHIIIPLVVTILVFSALLPTPATGFSEGFIRAPFDYLNNLFLDLTQQSEFSLRQVGFGGSGGRLGGDITPNDQVFMSIRTDVPMPLYLTGATRDTYTGNSWENLHDAFQEVDFHHYEQMFEFIEYGLSESLQWLIQEIEVINSGRLVAAPSHFFEIGGWPSENERVFIDELSGHLLLATTEQTFEFYMPVSELTISSFLHSSFVHYITIDNLDRRLTTLFHSGTVRDIAVDNDDVNLLRNREGAFQSEERLRSNTIYTVRLHRPQEHLTSTVTRTELDAQGNEIFISETVGSFQREFGLSYRGMLADISQSFQTFRDNHGYERWQMWFSLDGEIISYETLLNRHLIPRVNQIRDIYTQLPDDLPERVGELALEVTAEGKNDYERMRLIESFLSQRFPYTLTPGPSPANQDFVDHFLFDLQQGYCVHFATAFVVMARSLGMPTRYVEGFYVNNSGSDDIEVLNSMAHAWPEVYFEGFGWVRFEPTPASGLVHQPDSIPAGGRPGGGHWPDWEDPEYEMGYQNQGGGGADLSNNNGQTSNQPTETINISLWVWMVVGMICLLLVIVSRVGYLKFKRARILRNIGSKRILSHFELLLAYLKVLGFEIKDNETSVQFANRIREEFSVFSFERDLLDKSVAVFAKARYSKQSISKEECRPIEKLIRRIDRRMEDKLGRGRYLLYCHILGKF